MARTPNVWTNPANSYSYAWPVNHTTEEQFGKSRQMGDGAPTSDIGLIPQQGAPTPLVLHWKGTIFTQAHLDQMLLFWGLCDTQSVYIQDFSGALYEVLITDFEATRVACARNPKVPGQTWIWEYDLTMRVLTALSGDWVGVAP